MAGEITIVLPYAGRKGAASWSAMMRSRFAASPSPMSVPVGFDVAMHLGVVGG